MPINYSPQPEFPPWTDQISVVRASGEDGFNARFHAVFAEFVAISGHLRDVGAALDLLNRPVQVQPVTQTLTPVAVAFTAKPWEQGDGVVRTPSGATIAAGFMPLTLPHGAVLTAFTAFGAATGDSRALARLERQLLAGAPAGEQLAVVSGTNGTFTKRVDLAAGPLSTVDGGQFKYRLYLQWNVGADPTQTGQFTSFQLTYQPPA